MRICQGEGCDREPRNNTSPYCEKHYSRVKRHGDPNFALKDHTPARERWKKRYIVDPKTGCWEWTGVKSGSYGVISDGQGVQLIAHRLVWEETGHVLIKGMELDHRCFNKGCVNPDHLEQVSHTVNVRRGSKNGSNFLKTQCDNGHEFTPENTYIRSNGWRSCRACNRRIMREHYAKRQHREDAPLPQQVTGRRVVIGHCDRGHAVTNRNHYRNVEGELTCRQCGGAARTN